MAETDLQKIMNRFTPDRGNLLPLLKDIQDSQKWISPEAVYEVSRFMNISKNDVYSVATFYPVFKLTKPE